MPVNSKSWRSEKARWDASLYLDKVHLFLGDCGSTVVKVLCYKSVGRWLDPSWCNWIFHWHKILLTALWPWGRHNLQQKWVPGIFPGGKGGRCVRLTTYHHPVPLSWNLGTLISWNPLGPSRPVTGLLYLYLYLSISVSKHPPFFCPFVTRVPLWLLLNRWMTFLLPLIL